MRGWLMLECFDLPFKTTVVGLYAGTYKEELAALAPARTVPAMRTPEGGILTDSLAMAETLAEAHPDLPLYPTDPKARALARSMTCEMHSGYNALRGDCPMMLTHGWQGFTPSQDVLKDLVRIDQLWTMARQQYGAGGPWLFGTYSLADVLFAPVAARIATYGLPVSDLAQDYVATHLADPAFRRWRAMGATETYTPMPYRHDLPQVPWPGPTPMNAVAVDEGSAENVACPYSGEPVTHLAQIEGRIFGFCNAFCRDKTVADAAAWPKFLGLFER